MDSEKTILYSACLMLEIAKADNVITKDELNIIEEILSDFYKISNQKAIDIINDTYKELAGFITRRLDTPGYNKIQIGADIMKHMLEEIKRYEELMNHTEMGKTMKELGTE